MNQTLPLPNYPLAWLQYAQYIDYKFNLFIWVCVWGRGYVTDHNMCTFTVVSCMTHSFAWLHTPVLKSVSTSDLTDASRCGQHQQCCKTCQTNQADNSNICKGWGPVNSLNDLGSVKRTCMMIQGISFTGRIQNEVTASIFGQSPGHQM